MKARLVALAIASLAAVGLQPVQADTFFAYQGAPILEFSHITDGTSDVDELQPSKGTRTYHEIDVSVVSNGDPDTIDQVTFCLYKGTEFTDTTHTNGDETADDLCGYANGTGAAPSNPDPKHVAAFKWSGTVSSTTSADWTKEGTNAHEIDGSASAVATTTTTDYDDADEQSLTLNKTTFTFVFALSHATANAIDWNVRVSAQTTSLGEDGAVGGTGADTDVEQGSAIDAYTLASDGSTVVQNTYGVYFFAAFSTDTVRGQQDFGSVVEGGTSTVTEIDTASYWANDEIDISMIGTDFTATDGTTDTISLVTDDPTGSKAVSVKCYTTGDDTSALDVPSISSWTADTNILLAAQGPSGEDPETADLHDCELTYGEGATFGDASYSNTMTLGLLDSNITDGLTGGDFGLGGDGPPVNPEP